MTNPTPVTVIGLGPMGQAMTRRLLDAGHPVTVWNRTPARADALVTDGAKRAETPTEAVNASELVILSLTDYQAMYDILGPATDALAGRTVVNLSSDTPEQSRKAADWIAERDASFLTGGVMVPAPMVGTEASYVFYSGPSDVLDTHRSTLQLIGTPRYLGDDHGLAQLMYLANLDVFLTTLAALMHGTALLGGAGVSAKEAMAELMTTLAGVPAMLEAGDDLGAQIDAGDHPGHLSTVTMMGATADHIVAASTAAGIDPDLPRAVQRLYRQAIDAGHGADNWSRTIDSIRRPG